MRIIQSKNPRPLTLLALNNGGLLAAGSYVFGASGDVEVWDTASGEHGFTHRVPVREPHSLLFAIDGRYLLVGEQNRIAVVDAASHTVTVGPKVLYGFPECALAPSGEAIAFTESYDGRSRLACFTTPPSTASRLNWNVDPAEGFARFGAPAFDPSGQRVAVCATAIGIRGTGAEIQIRNAATGKLQVAIPRGAASPILGTAFTADGSKLLVRTGDRKVQLFDATTGAAAGELVHPGRPYVTGVAVHPRGPVACARTNGTVTFWDADTRAQLRTLDWKAGRLASVAFSPDGALAAAGTEDGKIVVWDVDV